VVSAASICLRLQRVKGSVPGGQGLLTVRREGLATTHALKRRLRAVVDAMDVGAVAGFVEQPLNGLEEVGMQPEEAVDPCELGVGGPRAVPVVPTKARTIAPFFCST
jgi:hypothetical protein